MFKGPFLSNMLAIAVSTWAADYLVNRFVIKSDSQDPEGFIMQTAGFGTDDVVRLVTYGVVGATVVGLMKQVR